MRLIAREVAASRIFNLQQTQIGLFSFHLRSFKLVKYELEVVLLLNSRILPDHQLKLYKRNKSIYLSINVFSLEH